MRDGVFSEEDTALVLNLLHLKGHEYRKTFGGKGTERIDFASTDRKYRIQAVKLLEFQHRHLAHLLTAQGKNRIGNNPTVARPGFNTGRTILIKIVKGPAPSILADSAIASGTLL